MIKPTSEMAFEEYIEHTLIEKSGWRRGSNKDWDVKRAVFAPETISFIQETQPKLWDQMQKLHGAELETKLVDALCKELDVKGTLNVLRHGFKFYGKIFRLAYFRPAHGLNLDVQKLYDSNRLTVTRQVPCHPNEKGGKGTRRLDLVFAINGLPVATCELKNPNTNQTWRDAVAQYKEDRDPNAPIFRFKRRALVHFAVDPDEVHMATRLAGSNTYFLPFNRGSDPGDIRCGSGNPAHESGYRTGYFWEDVLDRDSFLDIVGHFMFIEKRESKIKDDSGANKLTVRETVVFPRYHQLVLQL